MISYEKANKHVQISIDVKRITNEIFPRYNIYIATYTQRQIYQEIEEKSWEEFWSLKVRSKESKIQLKNPDVIITDGENVIFLVEVKWGAIEGDNKSDIDAFLSIAEKSKMTNTIKIPSKCYVRGPAVRNGQRFRSDQFTDVHDFNITKQSKNLLVTDFHAIKNEFGIDRFKSVIKRLNEFKDVALFSDIQQRIDNIPSFKEILFENHNSLWKKI